MRQSLLLAALASLAVGAGADDLYLSDLPVVLTASRIEQSPLDAPAAVTVIDRETIRASGMTEVHDLMRLVPGYQVADWAKDKAVVTNHGMANGLPHNLLVLLDGRSVVDPITGDVDWHGLPVRLDDIERVEVVRGPNQASYGAKAFNGVINIVTQQPGDEEGGVVALAHGQQDYSDAYVRLSSRSGSLDWRISASAREINPYRGVAGKEGFYRYEKNERQSLRASVAYRLSVEQELTADFGVVQGVDAMANPSDLAAEPYRERDLDYSFIHLGWRKDYAPGSEMSLRAFHYDRDRVDVYRVENSATKVSGTTLHVDGLVDLSFYTRRDDIEFQQIHRFSDALSGAWGAGYRRDKVESEHYFYGNSPLDGEQWQVFGNLDWRVAPDWLFHLGAMAEKNYNTDELFSPRIAVNHALDAHQSLRFSAGRGYRAPTLLESDVNELFKDIYIRELRRTVDIPRLASTGSVEPEHVRYWDVGYIGHLDGGRLKVDARLYSETYDDIIESLDLVYRNTEQQLRVRGAEVALDLNGEAWGRLRIAHSVIEMEGSGPDLNPQMPLSAPHHGSSLLWSRAFPRGIGASVGYYRVGEMFWLGDGNLQSAYDRLDLKLAKRFGAPGRENEVAIVVQNLNGRHVEFLGGTEKNYTEQLAYASLRMGW